MRDKLLGEPPHASEWNRRLGAWDRMIPMAESPNYEPDYADTVEALAKAAGVSPEQYALDHMLQSGGKGLLYLPILNYTDRSLDPAHDMLLHDHTIRGSPTAARMWA